MIGPGKYDAACTTVLQTTDAEAVIMLVINGIHGSGFSAQMPPEMTKAIPHMLRDLADQIERDDLAQSILQNS